MLPLPTPSSDCSRPLAVIARMWISPAEIACSESTYTCELACTCMRGPTRGKGHVAPLCGFRQSCTNFGQRRSSRRACAAPPFMCAMRCAVGLGAEVTAVERIEE